MYKEVLVDDWSRILKNCTISAQYKVIYTGLCLEGGGDTLRYIKINAHGQ